MILVRVALRSYLLITFYHNNVTLLKNMKVNFYHIPLNIYRNEWFRFVCFANRPFINNILSLSLYL